MNTSRRQIIASLAGMASAAVLPTNAMENFVDDSLRFGWLGRADVQEFIALVSAQHNLPRAWIEAQFQGLGVQPRALALMNPPPPKPGEPPRTRSWQKYRAIHVNTAQIAQGKAFLRQHHSAFESVRERFGVPSTVIAGIIGVETKFGRFTGQFPTLETLATLAFESPRRTEFFRKELESLLVMGYQGIVPVREVRGSFAGALGLPQFMPSSWRSYAVGFENTSQADLVNNPQDAIASVGNFLKQHGWQPNQASHTPAVVSDLKKARQFIPKKLEPAHTVAQLEASGIRQSEPRLEPQSRASLIDLPEEDGSVGFWFAANNFFVVTHYNRSYMYAAAVLSLAEALA